jgi:hypothetical protein
MCKIVGVTGKVSALLAAAIVAAIVALGADAAAQSRVGVVARAAADPPVSPSLVAEAFEAVVGDTATLLVEPRIELTGVLRERLGVFRRAVELSDEGWRAYIELEPEFAEARLAQARQRAVDALDLDGGRELVAEISVRLGAVRLFRGRRDEADEDFRLAAILDPDRPITDAEFRPDVVEAFERATAVAPGVATLAIASPRGAAVEVDGAAAGTAPVSVEVTVGHHVLVVRAAGKVPYTGIVEVGAAGQRVSLELQTDELASALREPLTVGTAEQQAKLRVEAALIHGELDAFVIAAPIWRHGAPALLGQRCEGVPIQCTEVVEIGFADPADLRTAAAELWSALAERRNKLRFPPTLLVDARLTRGEPRPGTTIPGNERAWWKNKWLWIGVGAVALGATSYLVFAGDDPAETIIGLDPCDFGGDCF